MPQTSSIAVAETPREPDVIGTLQQVRPLVDLAQNCLAADLWGFREESLPTLCGDWTQDLWYAKHMFYQWAVAPSPNERMQRLLAGYPTHSFKIWDNRVINFQQRSIILTNEWATCTLVMNFLLQSSEHSLTHRFAPLSISPHHSSKHLLLHLYRT